LNRQANFSKPLDIVIPVYNEGDNIVEVLESLRRSVNTPYRVLICYDRDDDTTLTALDAYPNRALSEVILVKNRIGGVCGAVLTGFADSIAPAVMVYCADDPNNATRVDLMFEQLVEGLDMVIGSRFIPGGCMIGCPPLKSLLVRIAAFTLSRFAALSVSDPTNGVRVYSRRLLEGINIESRHGWSFNLELLVKAVRSGYWVGEFPYRHLERTQGESRFRVMEWLPHYLRWYCFAFATLFSRKELLPPVSFAQKQGKLSAALVRGNNG
jgi:glycosyltransferase involved in cell wall biosynthesis